MTGVSGRCENGGELEQGLAAMEPTFRGYDDLVAELRKLGLERRTGTLFIATADNEGGQIGMRDGLIVHARFRRKTGIEAAYVLRKVDRARFSFTKDFVESVDPSLSSSAVIAVLTDVEMPLTQHHAPHPILGNADAVRRILTAALAEYLGPIAAVVVRDQLRDAERAGRAPGDVVDALAHRIDDRAAAAAFRASASTALATQTLLRR
jgi:Domain of unknown function (DUF4388)